MTNPKHLPDLRLKALANALYAYRTSAGLSQREMASELGVSYSTVGRVEACTGAPDVPTLLAILDQLDLHSVFFARETTAAEAYERGFRDCAAIVRSSIDNVPSSIGAEEAATTERD